MEKTFGECFRERYTMKPDCFGNLDYNSEKCAKCPVVGQCFEEQNKAKPTPETEEEE